jgi:hypothetical protein
MGSENLFHKRRSAKKAARKGTPKKDPYDRVLIVTEGEKTEPNYFKGLIKAYRLNTANIEVDGRCDSSPGSVYDYAKKRYAEEQRKGDAFDKVFIIIDKDTHTDYEATLAKVASSKPRNIFSAITSIPCFEYWVLLHFNFVTHPYFRTHKNSPCACVTKELKKYIPDYDKNFTGIYDVIADSTDFAISNSKRAMQQAIANCTDEPSTKMHEIVEYLRNIKNNSKL